MATPYESRYASGLEAVEKYDTTLRNELLVDNPMQKGTIILTYSHYDSYITGSAVLRENLDNGGMVVAKITDLK